MSGNRLLMIGLDAADFLLVRRWVEDGSLPNLGALMASGVSGRLTTSARYLVGSPWPTFYTGQPPTRHGLFHDYQWQHQLMRFARPSWKWFPLLPFWRRLDPEVRVITYDVPFLLGTHEATGIEVVGSASHDRLIKPVSHPRAWIQEVERELGRWRMMQEEYGASTPEYLIGLRDLLLEITRRSTRVIGRLLGEEWDLAIVVFGALHRGGHRLWDRSSANRELGKKEGQAFDGALRDLYVECDRSVGKLVAAAGDASVIVFALHGMTSNACRNDFLDAMLARALGGREFELPRRGTLRRLGEALPLGLRRALTQRLPAQLGDGIMTRWVTGGTDWSRTEAFCLRADLQGYIRINLEGREAQGIVSPSASEELCERIATGLASFSDAATGEPIVAEVVCPVEVFGAGERADLLPDLVLRWAQSSAAAHIAIESEGLGRIERATPGRVPNGRSGNHRTEGFFIAAGRGVAEGAHREEMADILDLAPTALEILGASCREELAGRPIPLFEPAAGGA